MEVSQDIPGNEKPNKKSVGETKDSNAIEISMEKLLSKIFELEMFEKLAHETEGKLRERTKKVQEKTRELDELEYEKLDRMENFCDTIWKLSEENDLCAIFEKYLKIPKHTAWNSRIPDIEHDPEISNLKDEIEEMKKQLSHKKSIRQNLEDKLTLAKINLQIAESYRENDPEIMRLRMDIEASRQSVQAANSKIAAIEKGISTEPQCSSNSHIEDKKYDFITASELLAKTETTETKNRPKFSVKKESAILQKMSSKRGRHGRDS